MQLFLNSTIPPGSSMWHTYLNLLSLLSFTSPPTCARDWPCDFRHAKQIIYHGAMIPLVTRRKGLLPSCLSCGLPNNIWLTTLGNGMLDHRDPSSEPAGLFWFPSPPSHLTNLGASVWVHFVKQQTLPWLYDGMGGLGAYVNALRRMYTNVL